MRPERVFAALGDETRLRIVSRLGERGRLSIARLTEGTRVTRQAIAKHLAELEQASLVVGERVGRENRFRLTPAPMAEAVSWMASVGSQWDERLSRLGEHLEERRP